MVMLYNFKECLKNHAVNTGGHAVDGCGGFIAVQAESGSLECAVCGCHRNFHRFDPLGDITLIHQHHHHHHLHQLLPLLCSPPTGPEYSIYSAAQLLVDLWKGYPLYSSIGQVEARPTSTLQAKVKNARRKRNFRPRKRKERKKKHAIAKNPKNSRRKISTEGRTVEESRDGSSSDKETVSIYVTSNSYNNNNIDNNNNMANNHVVNNNTVLNPSGSGR